MRIYNDRDFIQIIRNLAFKPYRPAYKIELIDTSKGAYKYLKGKLYPTEIDFSCIKRVK